MRAYEKKKVYRLMIRELVKAGKIPNADGTWTTYNDKWSAHKHMKEGYKV